MTSISPRHLCVQDNTTVAVFHASTGEGLPRHSHGYSHLTMCMAGSCRVENETRQLVMDTQTTPINLRAGVWHEIEALEDHTIFVNVFTIPKSEG